MSWFKWDGTDLILRVRIQPKASRDAFLGPYGKNEYRVSISSPPVDGKANSHLKRFLAKHFGLPRTDVLLEAGQSSRSKRLRLKSPNKMPIPLDESRP